MLSLLFVVASAGSALAQSSRSLGGPFPPTPQYPTGTPAETIPQSTISDWPTASMSLSGVPTMSMFLPMAPQYPVAASVITAAPSSTIYAISCPTNPDMCGGCDFDVPLTLTEGPSTVHFTTGLPAAQAVSFSAGGVALSQIEATVDCQLLGGSTITRAVCTTSSKLQVGNAVARTLTLNATQLASLYAPVAITSGAKGLASTTMPGPVSGTGAATSAPIGQKSSASGLGRMGGEAFAVAGIAGAAALLGLFLL